MKKMLINLVVSKIISNFATDFKNTPHGTFLSII